MKLISRELINILLVIDLTVMKMKTYASSAHAWALQNTAAVGIQINTDRNANHGAPRKESVPGFDNPAGSLKGLAYLVQG